MSSEAKKVERKYKRRLTEMDSMCSRQIQSLWKKHDSLKGASNNHIKAGILGKIVGIEWVLETLKTIQFKQERELDKYE